MHPTTASGNDVRALLHRWHFEGDHAARDEVAARMLPLARSLARRYANKGEPLDDLEQVACLGLIKAIDRFDLSRDVRFATYAVPTIAGELKRHFRDRGWMMRVPREVQELSGKIGIARERLVGDLSRSPTVGELARATGRRRGSRAGGAGRGAGLPHALARPAVRGRHRPAGGDRRRRPRLRARRGTRDARRRPRTSWHRASARSSACATSRASPSARSPSTSAISQMHVSRLIKRTVQELRERIAMPAAA